MTQTRSVLVGDRDYARLSKLIARSDEQAVGLVQPAGADASRRRISILAPVGAALIGLRVGERIAWPVPNGRDRHLEVVDVRSED